jgi:hypothetical protein
MGRVFGGRGATFRGDEGDELGDTFLDTLLCVLCYLCVVGESILHDAGDVGDREIGHFVSVSVFLRLQCAEGGCCEGERRAEEWVLMRCVGCRPECGWLGSASL